VQEVQSWGVGKEQTHYLHVAYSCAVRYVERSELVRCSALQHIPQVYLFQVHHVFRLL